MYKFLFIMLPRRDCYSLHIVQRLFTVTRGRGYFCWSMGRVSAPALTASAVNFFLISLILPKNPSSDVELFFPSHSSSWLPRVSAGHRTGAELVLTG